MYGSVTLTIQLRCFSRDDGRFWSTGCPSLDVYSQGSSEDEARRSLEEALELWFESCVERGTLHQALQEMGFRVSPCTSPIESPDVLSPSLAAGDDDELLGKPFDLSIELPAYHASLYQETRATA